MVFCRPISWYSHRWQRSATHIRTLVKDSLHTGPTLTCRTECGESQTARNLRRTSGKASQKKTFKLYTMNTFRHRKEYWEWKCDWKLLRQVLLDIMNGDLSIERVKKLIKTDDHFRPAYMASFDNSTGNN